ncbi:MAG: hypothetical protein ABIJ82_03355 [Patescibacteria group bacterium]
MQLWQHVKKLSLPKIEFSYLLLVLLALITISLNIKIIGENEFSVLSEQFLKGRLYLPNAVGDAVLFKGRYFWHLGPFPALMLVPLSFLTLGISTQPMPQGIANIFLIAGILYLVYKISVRYGFAKNSSRWLALAVVFASVFFLSALLPWSWHFSQTVTFFLGLLALYEYIGRKNIFLIGLYHALMFMTRFTSGFGIIFYLLATVTSCATLKEKVKKCLLMILPILLAGVFLLWYNYARFENLFDSGYTTSNNWVRSSDTFRYEMLKYGLFNVKNIPTNIYYYFLSVPSPVFEKSTGFYREIFKTNTSTIIHLVKPYVKVSSPGVSFFVISPIFLLMFRNRLKSKNSKYAAATSGFILLFLLTYYWTGWTQIGPRYMIDLLPFLLILLLESFDKKKITSRQKLIITVSALFNIFLFFSLFS